jgi:hypothetical protein
MEQFEKYKTLKEKLDITYRGIHFNRVLALNIWNFANSNCKFSIKKLAGFVISLNLKDFKLCNEKRTILSTYGLYNRKDHQELYYNVMDKLGDSVASNNLLHFRRKFTLNIKVIIYFTQQIFTRLKKSEFSFFQKLIISARFIHYANILGEIEQINLTGVKKYLSMCSVLDVENLLTQYMKKQGIETFSLQEGVYYIFKANTPLDAVSYENFETDHLLSWGQYSVNQYIEYGIQEKCMIVAGYPKNVIRYQMKRDNCFKKAIVLLARSSYNTSNFSLLNILQKYSGEYQFFLKFHPTCDIELYQNYLNPNIEIIPSEQTVNYCLNNDAFDFAIAVNTTAYYEALMRGIPCLRFTDKTFDLTYGYNDAFFNEKDFYSKINEIKNSDFCDYQNNVNFILEYAVGISIDNYKKILIDK